MALRAFFGWELSRLGRLRSLPYFVIPALAGTQWRHCLVLAWMFGRPGRLRSERFTVATYLVGATSVATGRDVTAALVFSHQAGFVGASFLPGCSGDLAVYAAPPYFVIPAQAGIYSSGSRLLDNVSQTDALKGGFRPAPE
jgi:hypothetical protein